VTLTASTDFPFDPAVSMQISTAGAILMTIRIRVPSWATGEMAIMVNNAEFSRGPAGSYLELTRTWSDHDTITFALQGELSGPSGVPHIAVSAEELPGLLNAVDGNRLEYSINGYPDYKYIPYWALDAELFTCFPIVQP
jgi:hypothetical protein